MLQGSRAATQQKPGKNTVKRRYHRSEDCPDLTGHPRDAMGNMRQGTNNKSTRKQKKTTLKDLQLGLDGLLRPGANLCTSDVHSTLFA